MSNASNKMNYPAYFWISAVL